MARFYCRFRPILITLLITMTAVLWFTPEALAAPYIGRVTYTYRQPDGSSFPVKLYGDEFFAYQRTLDGREVILDPKTRYWCYARLDASGRAFESLGIPVVTAKSGSQAANRTSALGAGATAPNQTLPADVVIERVRNAQGKFLVDDRGRPMAPTAAMAAGGMKALDGPAPSPPSRTTLGDFVGLCILVDFSDAPGTITQTQVDNFCNQPSGYVEFGNACSINEYYKIQSNGKFNFNNTVTAYVRMPQPKTYYDDNSAQNWGTAKAQELVATALNLLMADGFDFTTLSRDGSGYIYSINVFYAGTCASGWGLGLWPHSWAIPTKVVDAANGIRAYRYQMTDMKTSLSIGTFCHENGHMTCLYPDLYSYVNGSSIVAYYSLMASGNHAGGGKHPTNIDPYLKYKSGWADIVEVNSSTHVRATAQVDRNYYHKFTNPSDNREYFLIENRNNTGYEGPYGGHLSSVAPGRGLVVWQVWEAGSNTYSSIQQSSTYTTPYEAFVIEAAPTSSYTPWYSAPNPSTGSGDTFYAGYGADPLNDASSPDLHFWDHAGATGRTVNSSMTIHTYGAQGASLAYTIGAGTPPATPAIGKTTTALTPACDLGTDAPSAVFNVYNAGGGTLNYSISDNAAWLSCLPTSGSVTTGWAAITVTYATAALAPGQHTATITVTAPGASNTPQTIPVTLTVAPAPVLSVAPATISYDLWPGETDGSKYFSISNSGGGTMQYTVTDSAAWLTPGVASGNCSNETDLVYVSVDTAGLNAGVHTENVTVTAPLASGSPQQVAVSLTIHGGLQVLTPNGGEVWAVNWTETISWDTNVAADVRIELYKNGVFSRIIATSTANDGLYEWTLPSDLLPGNDYRIRVTTTDDAYTDDSNADFAIVSPIYSADMTGNPGWTLEGQWAYGAPLGGGGEYGDPDPTAGYTGSNVVGYNLAGDYPHSMATTLWATTPAFNCSNYTDVTLSFHRWLGVESGTYDHAHVEVSSNGVIWQPVWSNSATSMDGGAWEYVEYDLSTWADGQAAVQVRWGMGTTDTSVAYCGWNIDDMMVVGAYVAPATHTVTFQTDGAPGASITGTNPQSVTHGGDCTAVTAVAPPNWHFVQWALAGTPYSAANPLTVTNVTDDVTLTAEFATNTLTLTYAAGPNGTITGDSPQVVAHGGSGTPVTAVPNANHHFVNWSDGSTANPRTDTNVTASISVTANFAIDTHTLTYTAGPNGTITGSSPQTVAHGASGTPVTAVPNANHHFVNWSDTSTANPRTDANVTANISVTANFAIDTHTVTFQTDGTPGASLTGTTPQTVNHGASTSPVTAVPPANWEFLRWTVGGAPYSTANPVTATNVTADMTITAEFALDTHTLTYTAGPNGTITGDSPQTVAHGGNGTPVTAVPSANHHFVNWSDGSTANPRTDANVTASISVTAHFAIDAHTVTFQTDGTPGASISGTTPQTVNHGASATPVTAVPPANWEFLRWTVGGVPYSTANPVTATNVIADMTITVEFALDTYTLTYTAGPNGTITGDSPQTVPLGGNGTPVWASADLGYHFVAWSDDGTANPRTDTNVTSDIAVTAAFDIDPAPNAPLVTGPASPTNDARPTWTWISGGGGAGVFRYGWSEGDWLDEGSATSFRPDFGILEGDHTLYVQERHDAMAWSESGRYTVTIDITPPLLTVASALPAQATEGRAVVISVAANETLTDPPNVTVNGHPAAYSGIKDGGAYTYTYMVQGPATDPPGWAAIEATALDLAGNSGSITSSNTLQILPAQENLPAAGISMMALLALALAACATAALRRPEPVRQSEGHQHGSRAQREKGPDRH